MYVSEKDDDLTGVFLEPKKSYRYTAFGIDFGRQWRTTFGTETNYTFNAQSWAAVISFETIYEY